MNARWALCFSSAEELLSEADPKPSAVDLATSAPPVVLSAHNLYASLPRGDFMPIAVGVALLVVGALITVRRGDGGK